MKQSLAKETQIVFLLLPHNNMLDFAGAAQVFYEANDQGLPLSIRFCSFEDEIKTSSNLPLGKLERYSDISTGPDDFIFIVSAEINYMLSAEMEPDNELVNWLVNAHKAGTYVCSFCNGAFLLGKTGLLNNRECTTHWKRNKQLQEFYPLARVQENILFVEDSGVITSAGATSGVDVALHVLGKLKDDHFVHKVSRELVIYNRRSGSQEQQSVFLNYRNHMHAGIHRVQDWLQDNIHKKANIPQLADIALMSERNFTRIFKKETQLTVNEYINLLRVEKIKGLVKKPDLSLDQIASMCGLQSSKQIRRLMERI